MTYTLCPITVMREPVGARLNCFSCATHPLKRRLGKGCNFGLFIRDRKQPEYLGKCAEDCCDEFCLVLLSAAIRLGIKFAAPPTGTTTTLSRTVLRLFADSIAPQRRDIRLVGPRQSSSSPGQCRAVARSDALTSSREPLGLPVCASATLFRSPDDALKHVLGRL